MSKNSKETCANGFELEPGLGFNDVILFNKNARMRLPRDWRWIFPAPDGPLVTPLVREGMLTPRFQRKHSSGATLEVRAILLPSKTTRRRAPRFVYRGYVLHHKSADAVAHQRIFVKPIDAIRAVDWALEHHPCALRKEKPVEFYINDNETHWPMPLAHEWFSSHWFWERDLFVNFSGRSGDKGFLQWVLDVPNDRLISRFPVYGFYEIFRTEKKRKFGRDNWWAAKYLGEGMKGFGGLHHALWSILARDWKQMKDNREKYEQEVKQFQTERELWRSDTEPVRKTRKQSFK